MFHAGHLALRRCRREAGNAGRAERSDLRSLWMHQAFFNSGRPVRGGSTTVYPAGSSPIAFVTVEEVQRVR